MAIKLVAVIKAEDVGKRAVSRPPAEDGFGNMVDLPPIYVSDVIGLVQKIDIGKRVYDNCGTIQVESLEQMEKRLKRGV